MLKNVEFCEACGQPLEPTTRRCTSCGKLGRRPTLSDKMKRSSYGMRARLVERAPDLSIVDPDTDWVSLAIIVLGVLTIALIVAGKAGLL
jgi:hypothetical protein